MRAAPSDFANDLRLAARTLRRSPGFFAVAAGTLVIALAINAAMFTFVNAVFFRPLPYVSPDQLYNVEMSPREASSFEPLTLDEVRVALAPVSAVAGYVERAFVVSDSTTAGESSEFAAERLQGTATDERLFLLLGLTPRLGRVFTAADLLPGAERTVIAGDEFWRTRLGGTPAAIGRRIRIDGVLHTVIGVMPPRISFPDFAQFWVPLSNGGSERLGSIQALARLASPALVGRATLAMESAISASGHSAETQMDSIVPRSDAVLAALLGAIAFVLLIACSNVANIVIARGTARRSELSLRVALGASRASLVRYLAAEGVVLTGVATLFGTIASFWLTDVIVAVVPADGLPLWFVAEPDARTLGYTALLGLITVFVTAAMPAFTLTRDALATALNQANARLHGDARSSRLRSALMVVQIALAMILTAGAGLMIRAFTAVRVIDLGHPADEILHVATARAPATGETDAFPRDALTRLSAVPGVLAAGALAPAPVGRLVHDARPDAPARAVVEAVSPSYFGALGIPVLRGREFRSDSETGVMLISESLARLLFEDATTAIGASIRFENEDRAFTIVGMTADRMEPAARGMDGVLRIAHAYLPLTQGDVTQLRFVVRAQSGDPMRLAGATAAELRAADPAIVILAPMRLGPMIRDAGGNLRWFATIFTGFGTVALLLAAIGIYGVVAWIVGRRTREIGVRISLGATHLRIFQHVLASVAPAVGIGLGAGTLGALGLGLLLQSLLYGVSPADPAALAVSLAGFALTAVLAAGIPARRATRIDPLQATRSD